MTKKIFTQLDADGFSLGFWHSDVHVDIPEDAIEITLEQYQEYIDNQGFRRFVGGALVQFDPPPPPEPEIRVYKAAMFRKMTDAEYDTYLQIRASFPPRIQAIFDAAEYLSSQDEFWSDLVSAAEQAYGPERAAELLS